MEKERSKCELLIFHLHSGVKWKVQLGQKTFLCMIENAASCNMKFCMFEQSELSLRVQI